MGQEKPENRSTGHVAHSTGSGQERSTQKTGSEVLRVLRSTFYVLQRHLRAWLPKRRWLRRLVVGSMIFVAVALAGMYGIARWYIWSERNQPTALGVSFIPDYAQYLGLDPETTLDALITQLHVRNFRLVSYWSDIEPAPGQYNFTELDREFAQIAAVHGTVSLSIGLRQPRWPECHPPDWISGEPTSEWEGQLDQFMSVVVNRYKSSPVLQSYQLENEFFNNSFGTCTNFSRSRLVSEFKLVKKLDATRPVIVSRSNNYGGLPLGAPAPDEFGISVYRRVWMPLVGRYVEYPFPAWYYGFLAGAQKIITGKDSILHELQAEPFLPPGQTVLTASLAEQNKSLNAAGLTSTIQFAKATGLKAIDLWGAEYWYYRLTIEHDPSVWNAAKQAFTRR